MVCLPTVDPLICSPRDKPRLETANTARQLLYIEELVEKGARELREGHVLQFHKLAVEGIFPCGGKYRTSTRTAELEGGDVTHVPPEAAFVPGLVYDAVQEINRRIAGVPASKDEDIIEVAAYALWRFNWIHPFAGGNGRTSRAIAHLIFCMDFGGMILGMPSVPTIISRRRKEYETALRVADAAALAEKEDLGPMTLLVGTAIVAQLGSAVAFLKRQKAAWKKQKQLKTEKRRRKQNKKWRGRR